MSKNSKAAIAALMIAMAMWVLASSGNRESEEERRARAAREAAESYAKRTEALKAEYQRKKNRQIAQERYGDLWERDDRSRSARSNSTASSDPKVQRYLDVAWVHEFGAGWVLKAERFGETLHVTTTAEWSRGYYLGSPCSVQRDFVAVLFMQFKARHPDAHTVALLNPGGKEIGKFSRLWGYHCGD